MIARVFVREKIYAASILYITAKKSFCNEIFLQGICEFCEAKLVSKPRACNHGEIIMKNTKSTSIKYSLILIPLMLAAALLASCENLVTRTPHESTGGGTNKARIPGTKAKAAR